MTTDTGRGRRMVLYLRISDDREGQRNGTQRQERQCRELATSNGDTVVRVFVDDDRSAYSGKPRPDYNRMLTYLRDGHADGVYALAPTRLYRRLSDGLAFFQLIQERGLAVETVKAGRYDLTTADGRRDTLRAAIDSQYEAELLGERVRDAKADNVARGEWRGGPRPFGYEADGVTVCQPEAELIRWATDAVLDGDSLRSVCARLAARGVTTPARRTRLADGTRSEPVRRPWTPAKLRAMLLRARNAGLIEHRGRIVGPAVWEAVVPEDVWSACRAVLEDPARRTTPGRAPRWLGSGKYRCGQDGCTETMRVGASNQTRNGRAPTYRCRAGGHVTRIAAQLDAFVADVVCARLSRDDARQVLVPQPAAEDASGARLAQRAAVLRARLAAVPAEFAADDNADFAELAQAVALLRRQLADVEAQMASRTEASELDGLPLGDPEALRAAWDGFSLDRKRRIIDVLCTVTVLPSPRGRPAGWKPNQLGYFRPDRVRFDWKH